MNSFLRSLSPTRNYDALIAALAGALIIIAFTRHGGIGISPDSVTYISVADHLHDQGVLTDFNKGPLMDFPAGYPLFLSALRWITGLPVLAFGRLLNAILFGIVIYLSGWILERFSFHSKWYKWTILSCIVFSPCLLEVYSMIWSETLFLLFLLLFIVFFRLYFLSHSTRWLLVLALIAGLATVTRYAGITLLGTGGLLLLCDTRLTWGKKIRHLLLFGTLGIVPVAINLYHNYHATATLTGYREKGINSFGTNLHDFGSVFCDWMPFFKDYHGLASLVGLSWIGLFLVTFTRRLWKKEHFFSYENIATGFFIVYAIFILLTATISRFQTLDSRLLSPLFIPWLWGGSCWVPAWAATRTSIKRVGVVLIMIVVAISFQMRQLRADAEAWDGVRSAGIPGYTEDSWQHSETVDYIRQHKDSLHLKSTLYSNAEDAIWFLTGQRADQLPHKEFARDIREFLAEDHFYVVWFNDGDNPDLVSIEFIQQHKKLTRELSFNDGTIYYFKTDSLARPAP